MDQPQEKSGINSMVRDAPRAIERVSPQWPDGALKLHTSKVSAVFENDRSEANLAIIVEDLSVVDKT
jgi:hypothetical protein